MVLCAPFTYEPCRLRGLPFSFFLTGKRTIKLITWFRLGPGTRRSTSLQVTATYQFKGKSCTSRSGNYGNFSVSFVVAILVDPCTCFLVTGLYPHPLLLFKPPASHNNEYQISPLIEPVGTFSSQYEGKEVVYQQYARYVSDWHMELCFLDIHWIYSSQP